MKDTLSYAIKEARKKIADTRDALEGASRKNGWKKERIEAVTGLLTCGLVTLYDTLTEVRKLEIQREDYERGGSLPFRSRGIGTDTTPGCFVCGGETGMRSNISAFVKSREDGETIKRNFFNGVGVRLDFRPSEPDWIQVKVGACPAHIGNLRHLHSLVDYYGVIREQDAVDARTYACERDTDADGNCGQPACPNCMEPGKVRVCRIEEKNRGGAYPKSCPICGLAGPCAKGLVEKED